MKTLILFSIAAICITAVAITFVICYFNHLSSAGFAFRCKVIKDIEDLNYKVKEDIILYDGLRGTINKMKERIKALEDEK